MNFQIWWWHYLRNRRRWKNNLNKFKNHRNRLRFKVVLRGKGLSKGDWIRKQVNECLARFLINKTSLANKKNLHLGKLTQKIKKGKIFLVKTKQMNQKRIKNKLLTETKQSSKKEKRTKIKNKKSLRRLKGKLKMQEKDWRRRKKLNLIMQKRLGWVG